MKILASIIMLTLCSVSAFPQNNNLYEGAKNYASQIGYFDDPAGTAPKKPTSATSAGFRR
jgi:hypothetical protein